MMPLAQVGSFFANQSFSVAAYPTRGHAQVTPTEAHTVWAAVGTATPVPFTTSSTSGNSEKIVAAVGISMGFLGLVICFLIWWWCRKRIMAKREVVVFSRLRPQDKQEFLSSNPEAPFNPMRPAKRYYWALLCLPQPPGTAPTKIPKKKKFVPPEYAGPKAPSVHRQQQQQRQSGQQRGLTSLAAPVTYYQRPPSRQAPSAYDPVTPSVHPPAPSIIYGEVAYGAPSVAPPSSYGHYGRNPYDDRPMPASGSRQPSRIPSSGTKGDMNAPRVPPKDRW
jgi:hypothetical protein